MNEIQAAIGVHNLKYINKKIVERKNKKRNHQAI